MCLNKNYINFIQIKLSRSQQRFKVYYLDMTKHDDDKGIFKAVTTGFIDHQAESNALLQPKLILNDRDREIDTLSYLVGKLEVCSSFWFSTAFLTNSGLATLHNALKRFSDNNQGSGEIIISDYLSFTQPDALERLSEFKNIETRLYSGKNYHGKGYLFKVADRFDFLIGSSNLTAPALRSNAELNIHLSSAEQGGLIREYLEFFNRIFQDSQQINPESLLEYGERYKKRLLRSESNILINDQDGEHLTKRKQELYTPNLLQKEATENLAELRSKGSNRALVVSATGTGKTVLAAFDVKQFKAKRMLFVVHRYTIAKKAMDTFGDVFDSNISMGLFSGDKKETNKDFLFSTIQTINKDQNLQQFDPDAFDYIVIDETHRAAAVTYQKIIDYFNPGFLLGMTATPERTDGFNIFELFNNNIGCEIRLHRAMTEDLLCPFHYFGVTDITVEGRAIDDQAGFNLLIHSDRVDKIIKTIREYGCDDGDPRGLIFCSSVEEAQKLSVAFNSRGFNTVSLSGNNSNQEREDAIYKIESNDVALKIDYIFTVDVFNEGIDIPRINQIIMLRPTQSAIIFIQQLGRGLRKLENKEYLTVIDFIGNYQNNYMIPIALYGDSSLNKDTLRKLVSSGSSLIPGCSTVNFDEITKEQIFESIDSAKLNKKKDLEHDYQLMKFRLGRNPMMMDFLDHESRDPFQFVLSAGSFYKFSCDADQDSQPDKITDPAERLLGYLSRLVNDGARGVESLILINLIKNKNISVEELQQQHHHRFQANLDEETIRSAINCLNLEFHTETFKRDGEEKSKKLSIKEIYDYQLAVFNKSRISIGKTLSSYLDEVGFKEYLIDSANYSLSTFNKRINKSEFVKGFIRYEKYSRQDVFRILNWKKNPVAINVGGYQVSEDSTNCAIFVTYKKSDEISDSTKYEDEFISPEVFTYKSKSKRFLTSPDVVSILSQEKNNIRLPLFVKKSDDEGQSHYYIGELELNPSATKQELMQTKDGKKVSVVNFEFKLDKSVDEDLYKYIIS